MTLTSKPQQLYTQHARSYLRFVGSLGYPQGIRAFFRQSNLLKPSLRILDAGCGTGIVSLALYQAMTERGLTPELMQGFDLTEAMMDLFRTRLGELNINGSDGAGSGDKVELRQADVLKPEMLPDTWTGYDLIVSASMFEYIPSDRLPEAMAGLARRLKKDGTFVLFITRDNFLMRQLIGRWWESNLYAREQIKGALAEAGFSRIKFAKFPPAFSYLGLWGHVIEAGI